MPSQISGAQYIEIPTHDENLIGQYFNRELMEFQVVYYYAVLNSTGIVESTIFYTTQQTETNTLIAITYSQYSTVIGLYWNGTEFIDPPISIIAVASTNEISYKNEEKWLSTKLDEIEDSIENISLTPGADGKSAYQIAQDNGYTGTETEWLESLHGATGATGATGVDGQDGANGLSAYELAVQQGYSGDLTSWLASLHGADGQDGVDGTNGTNGTDGADGQDGADGKSAYQIAVDNGFVGNESAWLASLVGATGAKGDKGDTGDAGQDGADGTTVAVGTTTTGAAGTNASVTSTYNSVTNTITLDFTIPRGATGESGSSANITADEVLTKIKTVDGANSGLDADTLDGIHASGFSASNHNHNGTYALYEHTHSNYLTADNLNGYATTEAMNTALSGKADSTHTHSNYASTTDVTALQTALNNKADSNHTHSEYASVSDLESVETALSGKASSSHTHAQSEVTGLASALSGKADSNHTHDVATTSANGFMSSADKTKLNGIETGANKTIVDASLSSTSTNPVQNKAVNTALAGKASTSHTHTLDDVSETDSKKIMTAAERTKLSGIASNANNYTLPTASTTLGGVKTTSTVSSSTGYTACPIISGVPYYKDTNTTYNNATASSAGLMSTSDKTKLDGIATGANNYSLPTASASTLGGVKVGTNLSISNGVLSATDTTYSVATTSASGLMSAADKTKLDGIATGANKTTVDTALSSTSTNPVQNKVINTALSGKAASSHTHAVADITGTLPISKGGTGATTATAALTNLGITATAAELNKMDGVTATTTELNYVDGVTSNIQNQLNAKAASSHNHNSAYISKSLQMTDDDGNAELKLASGSSDNLLTKIKALSMGMHTFYSASGNAGNPKTTEAWRGIVFKTGANYGFVQAYGSIGSVYTNYLDGDTWRGWKAIYDIAPTPLWTGAMYMTSTNGTPQTVTPSKKLSECRNGWLLLWSDYDPGDGANDADFATTIIPKKNPSGGTWGGKSFLCDIPRYVGSDPDDTSTEKRIIKPIYVHDDCIKGSYQNASGDRNDVVLRCVMEW